MKKALVILLCLCTVFALFSCARAESALEGVRKLNAEAQEKFSLEMLDNESYAAAYRDFSYRFFRTVTGSESKNLCLSPLSAYMAFSLCFYGSESTTAEEFKAVFGLDKEQAAEYCRSLYAHFMQRDYTDETTNVNLANSVWVDNRVASYVKENYLTGATSYFDASIYGCDFTDEKTVDAVNGWCSDNTDGLIDKIIDSFDDDQLLALINALLVEAAWATPYSEQSTVRDYFLNADGSRAEADYLCRKITACYLTDDAKAFSMPLCDGFSFLGILPDETLSADDYAATLTAEKMAALLTTATREYDVYTRIPKFTLDYETDLVEPMTEMGLASAFNAGSANFKGLAELPGNNLYIGTAIQKTHFELDEKGIKAAAITYIGMKANSAAPISRPKLNIYLDRPFLYLLIDDKTGLPLFIGRINELGK